MKKITFEFKPKLFAMTNNIPITRKCIVLFYIIGLSFALLQK